MPKINFTNFQEVKDYPWEEILNQSEYWMDRYGELHRLEDMSTEHLKNILPFIRSGAHRVEMAIWYMLSVIRGEMAEMEAEKDLDRYMSWEELPLYEAVKDELRRRGIEVEYNGT